MNFDLAAAVAQFVHTSDAESARRLRRFSWLDWKRADFWLDTSGLALRFIHGLDALNAADALPPRLAQRLRQNIVDNRTRTEGQFQEFCRVNTAFAQTGRPYAVHKGFSVVPDFCPDPALRTQFDFDFYIDPSDYTRFDVVLRSLGYSLVETNEREARYDTHPGKPAYRRDIYKPTDRSRVELHLDFAEVHGNHLDGAPNCVQHLAGATFPALSRADRLVEHAQHIFQHARSGWVRPSWLLEWLTVGKVCSGDAALWTGLRSKAEIRPSVAVALGFATALAAKTFTADAICELTWAAHALSVQLQRWIQRYGQEFALTAHPGTKLHLLAAREFEIDANSTRKVVLPLHKPAVVAFSRSRSPFRRIEAALAQSRFLAQRTAFHLRSNLRYWRESRRWTEEGESIAE